MRRIEIKANRLRSYVFLMMVWEVLGNLGQEILLYLYNFQLYDFPTQFLTVIDASFFVIFSFSLLYFLFHSITSCFNDFFRCTSDQLNERSQ